MAGEVNVTLKWTRGILPAITTGTLTSATVGSAYSFTLAFTGTPTPTIALQSGTLPAGLSVSSAGVISGTPTVVATTSGLVFRATNSAGFADSVALSLTVSASSGPTLITSPYIYEYTDQKGTPPGGANITTTTVGKLLICRFGNYTLDLDDAANTDRYPLQRLYQWYRNGVAISSAIGTTYPVVAADSGNSITCIETVWRVASPTVFTSFTSANAVVPSGTRDAALVYQDNLVYLGAFRLPNNRGAYASDFEGPGRNINAAWNAAGDSARGSLFIDSFYNGSYVGTAEVAPPRNVDGSIKFQTSSDPSTLDRGTFIQTPADVNEWARNTTYFPADANGVLPLGKLIYNGKLIASASYYYDGVDPQLNSHVTRPTTLATNNFTNVAGVRATSGTFSVSSRAFGGKMCLIPSTTVGGVNYQTALGGKALTGVSGGATVATGPVSYSMGSAAFDPDQLTSANPVTAYPLVMYSASNGTFGSLGLNDGSGYLPNPIFQLSQGFQADKAFQLIPTGTRSLLFGGVMGDGGTVYGSPGGDLVNTTFRGANVTAKIYDPNSSGSGFHSYPYRHKIFAYDLADLALVKAGSKSLESVQPYARWDIVLPNTTGDVTVAQNPIGVYNSNDKILLFGVVTIYGNYIYEGDMVVHGYQITNAV
jgi:hypothetical protein